jgi:act minimal PKS acyl carrier protein
VRQFTLDDLTRLLRTSGGVQEGVDLAGDIVDEHYSDLGYDSLALLEMSALIEREFGVTFLDEEIAELKTPRETIELVNRRALEG